MFDRAYQSALTAKKEGLRPVYAGGGMARVSDKVEAFCKAQGFADIIRNDSFHEISANCPPFCLTFILVNDDHGTVRISIFASTERIGGGCKKMISALNSELKDYLGINIRKG